MSRLPRVLIVDDDADLLELVADALSAMQLDVTAVNDPVRALGFASFMKFDVVITDFDMPHLNGAQVASVLKQTDLNSRTPLLVMSGNVGQPDIERLEKIGVIEVLHKPVAIETLQAKISSLIRPPVKKILAYHPQIVAACTDGIADVLRFYLDKPLDKAKPWLKNDRRPPGLFSSLINIYGRRVYGTIGLGLDSGMMAELVKKLYMGEIPGELRDHDGMVGEILNQVAGKVKSSLTEMGLYVHIGLPEMINANVSELQPRVSGRILVMPIKMDGGVACLELCLGSGINNERLAENMTTEVFLSQDIE